MLTYDQATERVNLSTKRLERQPGDMTRNPAAVYAQAEETAKSFRCAACKQCLGCARSVRASAALSASCLPWDVVTVA